MAQLTGLGIENFRIFKDYTEFEFAPLTLLTGANNSGKSSLIKALLLLAVNVSKKLERFTLDFEAETIHTKLGDFASVATTTENNIQFSLHFKNLYKQLDRPVHHEKLADEVFEKLASKSFVIEMQFDAQQENNMTNFSLSCVDKEEKIQLLSFDFAEKAQKVSQKINYVWLEKFVYEIEGKPFKDKDPTLQNFYHPIERFKDLFSVIDLAFNTNGDSAAFRKKYHFHILDEILKKLVEIAFETLEFGDKIEYLPAFRGNQERFYYENGLPLNKLLKQFTNKGFKANSKEQMYLDSWIERLGIGKRIELIPDIGGTKVNIINGTDRPMADYGFGITQYLPLLLKIVLNPNKVLLVEEGENSLHPNFQSLLADLLIDAHKNFGINFIVETHSEYLVRKMQYLVSKKAVALDHTMIYYFNNPDVVDEANGISQIVRTKIKENGGLDKNFGSGFYDEAAYWAFQLSNQTIR